MAFFSRDGVVHEASATFPHTCVALAATSTVTAHDRYDVALQTRYQPHDLVDDVFAMSQLRLRLTLRVYIFDDSLAQATFRIERVDHKLNLTGESVRKLEFSVTVGFPECNSFARVDVDLKVGGVSEPCRDTAFV